MAWNALLPARGGIVSLRRMRWLTAKSASSAPSVGPSGPGPWFYPATGYNRSGATADCWRWEAHAFYQGVSRSIGSYDTMTDCARYGVEISFLRAGGAVFELSVRQDNDDEEDEP